MDHQRRDFNRHCMGAALGGTLLGPGVGTTTARAARSASSPLVVWFTVEGAKGMRQIAQDFTRDTGVEVVIETPDEGPAKFQQAAAAGKGPDIYVYAHDRIGEWMAAGLIHSVTPRRQLLQDIDLSDQEDQIYL